jgi:hypothetical protein
MLLCQFRLLSLAAILSCWLSFAGFVAAAEEPMSAQPAGAAAQAGAAALQNFTEFLKAEAARAEAATKHESEIIDDSLKRQSDAIKSESDTIERIFSAFQWAVGITGLLLLAGAAYLGHIMEVASRTTKTDIETEVKAQLHATVADEVRAQLHGKVTEEIESHAKNTHRRIEDFETNTIDRARMMEANIVERLGKQVDSIMNYFDLTMGTWPSHHLKTIYEKKIGKNSDSTFVFHDQDGFKSELGFLINKGYLHLDNTSLDKFKEGDNMLDKLIVTHTGKQYLDLREKLERPEHQA